MALNYAEQWSPDLLEILMQGTLTSPFVTSNVRWLDAKTFHFTQMAHPVIRTTAEKAAGILELMIRRIYRTH